MDIADKMPTTYVLRLRSILARRVSPIRTSNWHPYGHVRLSDQSLQFTPKSPDPPDRKFATRNELLGRIRKSNHI